MGGLSKKAYQFTKLLRTKPTPSVIVDGGGLLFKNSFIPQGQEAQLEATAEGIVKAYNLIGYDAVAVSSRDLAAGLDFLLGLQENSLFEWPEPFFPVTWYAPIDFRISLQVQLPFYRSFEQAGPWLLLSLSMRQ